MGTHFSRCSGRRNCYFSVVWSSHVHSSVIKLVFSQGWSGNQLFHTNYTLYFFFCKSSSKLFFTSQNHKTWVLAFMSLQDRLAARSLESRMTEKKPDWVSPQRFLITLTESKCWWLHESVCVGIWFTLHACRGDTSAWMRLHCSS